MDLSRLPWRCNSCGCELEFDARTRRSRIVHFPDDYAALESAIGPAWLSRREMFERVEAAQAEQTDAARPSPQARWLGWAAIATLALLVLCIMLGAVASALVISPNLARTRRTISEAYQPTPTVIVAETPSIATEPGLDTAAMTSPVPDVEVVATPEDVIPAPAATPTPPSRLPEQPTVLPALLPTPALESPLPAPQVTLPPTFTPAAPPQLATPAAPTLEPTVANNGAATPPGQAVATPTEVAASPTDTPTAPTAPPPTAPPPDAQAPAPTPTLALGSVIFPGAVYQIRVRTISAVGSGPQQPDEYVELFNEGLQPAYIDGWSLKAIRLSDNTIIDTYLFGNGAIIAAGQVCRIYTNVLTAPDNCGFSGGFASDEPIWPDNGGARASLFNQQNIEQARYTY